jgi:protein-S-isoprenylcysteine O-methyltransferase Ste14
MLILKNVIFTLLVPGAFGVLIPCWIASYFHSGQVVRLDGAGWMGLVLIVCGVTVYFLCLFEFMRAKGTPAPIDPPKELVVRGLYRYTRNPMYVGVLSIILGQAVTPPSLPLLFYAGVLFVTFHLFVVLYEEPKLTKMFGETYRNYCHTVPRWFVMRKRHNS